VDDVEPALCTQAGRSFVIRPMSRFERDDVRSVRDFSFSLYFRGLARADDLNST